MTKGENPPRHLERRWAPRHSFGAELEIEVGLRGFAWKNARHQLERHVYRIRGHAFDRRGLHRTADA